MEIRNFDTAIIFLFFHFFPRLWRVHLVPRAGFKISPPGTVYIFLRDQVFLRSPVSRKQIYFSIFFSRLWRVHMVPVGPDLILRIKTKVGTVLWINSPQYQLTIFWFLFISRSKKKIFPYDPLGFNQLPAANWNQSLASRSTSVPSERQTKKRVLRPAH